jgi:hypothetical protein
MISETERKASITVAGATAFQWSHLGRYVLGDGMSGCGGSELFDLGGKLSLGWVGLKVY